MTDFDDFERRLAASLRSDADASFGPFEAGSIARAAIADTGPGATRVRRSSRPAGRLGRGRGMTLLAAAAVLLVGGALVGSGIVRLPSVVPPAPAPSLALIATASPDATTTPMPTPSAFVTPSPPPSLDLTWTQLPIVAPSFNRYDDPTRLAWLGDRFVLVDVKSGSVRISTDGEDWQALQPGDAARSYVELLRGSFASWQDTAVGWWNPEDHAGPETAGGPSAPSGRDNVQIVRPPAVPPSTTPFRGRIHSIGIGPRGIVAQVHSHLDLDAWITKELGLRTNNDWTCCVKSLTFKDGVLELKLNNRRGLKVVWADEGFEPGDIFDGGFGWYSPDGEQWTATTPNDADYPSPGDSPSNLPTGFGQVVGVSDGFIASGGYAEGTCADPNGSCTGIWYSPDGLSWRLLGTAPELGLSDRELCIRDECQSLARGLLPWKGGALAIHGEGRITYWTSGGPAELPMTAQVHETVATGPLGLVSIGDGQVLVSRDGIDSKVSSLPAQMADGGEPSIVAVGDRTVLVLERRGTGEFTMTQSLWLGTFEP